MITPGEITKENIARVKCNFIENIRPKWLRNADIQIKTYKYKIPYMCRYSS